MSDSLANGKIAKNERLDGRRRIVAEQKEKMKQYAKITGDRIRILRKERKYSSRQFAAYVFDVDNGGCITKQCEKGENVLSSFKIIKISKYFNVSADWLLGLTDERQKPKGGETMGL